MEISWLAVLVAAIVKFAIGALWYSPVGFLKQWQEATKAPPNAMEGTTTGMIAEAIGDLVMAYILARFIAFYGHGFWNGILIGVMAWLGFVAPFLANQIYFEKRPQQVAVINGAYSLISLIVMGAILGVWY
jgi:hypothetical protein